MALRPWIILSALVFGLPAFAAETRVEAFRQSSSGCAYFSSVTGRLKLSYENRDLPWGSRVELIYGFEERSNRNNAVTRNWVDREQVEVPAVAASLWGIELSRAVESRGAPAALRALQFVWKLTLPDGSIQYDRGTDAPMGYYRASFAHLPLTCSGTAFQALPVSVISN